MSIATNWMPVIITIVAAIVAAVSYSWQMHLNRRTELISKRRDTYADFFACLNEYMSVPHLENRTEFFKVFAKIHLVGTDNVAMKSGAFMKLLEQCTPVEIRERTSTNYDDLNNAHTEMMIAMRCDCFEKSKLEINVANEYMVMSYSDGNNSEIESRVTQ